MVVNNPEGIIDKEELHKFKITIHNKNNFPTKNEDMLNKIGQDIVNPDDIILPRRPSKVLYQFCDTYYLMFIIEKLYDINIIQFNIFNIMKICNFIIMKICNEDLCNMHLYKLIEKMVNYR